MSVMSPFATPLTHLRFGAAAFLLIGGLTATPTLRATVPPALVPEAATITAVEVFPRSARVTRTVKLVVPDPGRYIVSVQGLPASLDPAQVVIEGLDGALQEGFASFNFKVDPEAVEAQPAITDLLQHQKIMQGELAALQLQRDNARQRAAHYRTLASAISESLKQEPSPAGFELSKQAWAEYEEVRGAAEEEQLTLNQQIQEQEKALGETREELTQTRLELRQLAGVARFEIQPRQAGPLELHLHYVVPEAGWSTQHEINARPASQEVVWHQRASVNQHSGENWEQVSLTLNANQPAVGTHPPTLSPIRLNQISPGSKAYLARAQSGPRPSMDAEAESQTAALQATTTSFLITLNSPTSIRSGGPSQQETVLQRSLPAQFHSAATPALAAEAFLIGEGTNGPDWPILPGRAFLSIDGRLSGRDHLDLILPGEPWSIGFGTNPYLRVERRELVRSESEGGLIDRVKRHQRKFETSVHNAMKVAQRVVIHDHVPISQNNRIQIRVTAPRNLEVDPESGAFTWERTVASGQSATFTLEYEVTQPLDWVLPPF